jgi:uncharacterized protein YndB with AHSA1/START domain
MSVVTASIDIAAAPEAVWDRVMDPRRLGDWVTIHRKLIRADDGPPRPGFQMVQRLHLRGVRVDVHWTLVECETARLAVWEGRGPARSRAQTVYTLDRRDGVTRFDYRNEFSPPLGVLGAIVARTLERGMPRREATRTLERLRALVEKDTAGRADSRA